MGFLRGKFNISAYHVNDVTEDAIIEATRTGGIKPLTKGSLLVESIGFCNPETGLTDFDYETMMMEGAIHLGLRIDTKKVPSSLVNVKVQERLRASVPPGGYSKKVIRQMKQEFKEDVISELLCDALPSVKIIELLWNLDTGIVYINNTSKKINDSVFTFLSSTFNTRITGRNDFDGKFLTWLLDQHMEEKLAIPGFSAAMVSDKISLKNTSANKKITLDGVHNSSEEFTAAVRTCKDVSKIYLILASGETNIDLTLTDEGAISGVKLSEKDPARRLPLINTLFLGVNNLALQHASDEEEVAGTPGEE